MPRKKPEVIKEPEAKIDAVLNTGLPQEFVVCNSSGDPVRSYTLDLHGEKAEDNAKEFAANIGGFVRA